MLSPNDTTRICKTCKQSFLLTDEYFPTYANRIGAILFRHLCYSCWKAYRADGRKRRDPEKVKAEKQRNVDKHPEAVQRRRKRHIEKKLAENPDHYKEVYQANKLAIIARVKQWQKDNPNKVSAKAKRSYEIHKEEKLAWQKEYYREHPEVKRFQGKKYRESHKEQIAITGAEYNKTHPNLRRRIQATRRARMKAAEGTFSDADIKNMYIAQDGKCQYCGCELNGKFHIDHIQPLARGGSNWPDNLACACADCNLSKSDKTLDEWVAMRGW